jgi:hypothetical protein
MPEIDEEEDDLEDGEGDEEDDDDADDDDIDEREEMLDLLAQFLEDSLVDNESVTIVDGDHIEITMADETKWKLTLKQIA